MTSGSSRDISPDGRLFDDIAACCSSSPSPARWTRRASTSGTTPSTRRRAWRSTACTTAERFRAADDARPTWLATYDLELETSRRRRSTRRCGVGPERAGGGAGFATLDRRIYAQTDDWGTGDGHPPLMVATSVTTSDPGRLRRLVRAWSTCRCCMRWTAGPARGASSCSTATRPSSSALHELQSAAPLDTDGYRHAISTPWRDRGDAARDPPRAPRVRAPSRASPR